MEMIKAFQKRGTRTQKNKFEPGKAVHIYNSNIKVVEAGGS
jgi:hypothetical protein